MDYFMLKTIKAQKELFTSPLTESKNLDWGPGLGRELHQR